MALHILEDLTNRFPQFSAHYQRINECAQKTELEFVVHRLAYKRNVAIDLKFRFHFMKTSGHSLAVTSRPIERRGLHSQTRSSTQPLGLSSQRRAAPTPS